MSTTNEQKLIELVADMRRWGVEVINGSIRGNRVFLGFAKSQHAHDFKALMDDESNKDSQIVHGNQVAFDMEDLDWLAKMYAKPKN